MHEGALPTPDQAALVPAENFNLVTVRQAPAAAGGGKVFCVSPSPDWAFALARQASAAASGSAPSGPTVSLSGSGSSSETITSALGKTAGVVALRDGLYQACQAYANGQIGRLSYALILSQYGNVLADVIGQASATPTGAAAAGAMPAGSTPPTVNVALAATPPTGGASGSSSASPTSSTAAATQINVIPVAQMQQEHIQALVVSCLNQYDPSLPDDASLKLVKDDDILLTRSMCKSLINAIIGKATDQLIPVVKAQPASALGSPDAATDGQAPRPACPDKETVKTVRVSSYKAVLKSLGFYSGPINESDDAATTAALTKYQLTNGLCASGLADRTTLAKMKLAGEI